MEWFYAHPSFSTVFFTSLFCAIWFGLMGSGNDIDGAKTFPVYALFGAGIGFCAGMGILIISK